MVNKFKTNQPRKLIMNSIQKRGQFFVEELSQDGNKEPIPIDNFVFYTFNKNRVRDGLEVRIEGVGGDRVVVTYGNKNKKSEWFETYAQALRRMADILEGNVKIKDFGNK